MFSPNQILLQFVTFDASKCQRRSFEQFMSKLSKDVEFKIGMNLDLRKIYLKNYLFLNRNYHLDVFEFQKT